MTWRTRRSGAIVGAWSISRNGWSGRTERAGPQSGSRASHSWITASRGPAIEAGRTGYALAKDDVNHVGEPIAMVVATNRYVAEDAAQRIVVSYEFLPPVVGIEKARDGADLVHDDAPGNVAAHLLQEVGDVESALASAPT